MNVIGDLQQMQCDPNKLNKKTDSAENLQKIASDKGFSICDNTGSGNCMFFALSEQLQSVKGIQISETELRTNMVQFLRDNPKLVSHSSKGCFSCACCIKCAVYNCEKIGVLKILHRQVTDRISIAISIAKESQFSGISGNFCARFSVEGCCLILETIR